MTIVYRIAEFNIFLAGMEDNGTLGWLIEFGLIKQNQRTEQSKQIKEYGSQSHNYILIMILTEILASI